jgi:hypothetical protein
LIRTHFSFREKVCGAMVRLSATPIVNVTSGGGETGFFVFVSNHADRTLLSWTVFRSAKKSQ